MRSIFHAPKEYFTRRRRISLKKALAFASAFFMAGAQGFEPRKCQSQSLMPYRLATPQYFQQTILYHIKLSLSIPILNFFEKIIHYFLFFRKIAFFYFTNALFCDTIQRSDQNLPVAQLDSASDSDSEGQRFESVRVGQNKAGGQSPPVLFSSTRMVKRNVTPREACVKVQNPFG